MDLQVLYLGALLILFAAYTAIHAIVKGGLLRISFSPQSTLPPFSVIIAARNEEHTIERCLHSLLAQDYPKDFFEIIVVNDRSEDKTEQIVRSIVNEGNNLKLLTVTETDPDMPAKKSALRRAIQESRNSILAFTDADSVVPPGWLKALASAFSDEVGVVAGYSPYDIPQNGIWHSFLRYEELKNSIGAAAGIGWQRGYMCTGRSFAYRREVYDSVGGFESIKHSISGDDDLFIQRVEREHRWQMRYIPFASAAVLTKAPENFSRFVNQRTRHFSTGKYYPLRMKLIFGLLHGFNFLLLPGFFIVPDMAAALLFLKLVIDFWIVAAGGKIFSESFSFFSFLTSEILYILYNILIGPLGFLGSFSWKGAGKI
jgi:cellulose synthase/poly-beta-1,6-N-acetylglucosamine synthase-like glycosyltransferase